MRNTEYHAVVFDLVVGFAVVVVFALVTVGTETTEYSVVRTEYWVVNTEY